MMLADVGIESVKLPPRSPNLNAYAERFVRTIKESCLEQMILFGEESLRTSIRQFVDHYHLERNHQALENRLINPMEGTVNTEGTNPEARTTGWAAELLLSGGISIFPVVAAGDASMATPKIWESRADL
jgi:transposase InsO family protein